MNVVSDKTRRRIEDMLAWWDRVRTRLGMGGDNAPIYAPGEDVPVYNGTGETAPRGSNVNLTTWNSTHGAWNFVKGDTDNTGPFAVLMGEVLNGDPGRAFMDFRPHPMAVTSQTGFAVGDIVGATDIASWYATEDADGQYVVTDVPADDTAVIWAARLASASGGEPYLYKVTDDSPLEAKRVDNAGAVTGDAETFVDGSAW